MPIRILIVDDHTVVRTGLRLLLEARTGFEVVGEAADGASAIEMVETLNPDIVLLDITMPGLNGLDTTKRILKKRPRAKILVLTMHDDVGYLQQLFRAGASGYVVKHSADVVLVDAIQTVYSGRRFVDPTLAGEVISSLWQSPASSAVPVEESPLSEREQEVLRYIAQGYTNKETADRMHVSVKTVESYRMRLMHKLGFQTRAELVRYAAQKGVLSL